MRLQNYLAKKIKALRLKKGWTQEQLNQRARKIGLAWKKTKTMRLETHDCFLSLGDFLMLPLLFDIKLADLFDDYEDYIEIRPSCRVSLETLRAIIENKNNYIDRRVDPSLVDCNYNEADIRAAKRLNMNIYELDQTAHTLWRRSFCAERDFRLSKMGGDSKNSSGLKSAISRKMGGEIKRYKASISMT